MATYTWNGQLDGEWGAATDTLTNWDGPGMLPIPGANDTAIISKTATIARDDGGGNAQEIQINGGATVTFASTGFEAGNAGIGGLTVDDSATLIIASAASMLDDGSLDVIGLAQNGSLELQTGAELSTPELTVGANAGANGDLTAEAADLLIRATNNPGLLTVGENGEGSVDIAGNSNLDVGTTIVGQNAGSTGMMIVDDSTWSGANLTIGSSGLASGNVTVENASSVFITNIAIGAKGELDVTGLVTTTVIVSELTIAFGTLSVSGGGEVNVVSGAGVQGAVDIGVATVAGLGTINANVVLETGGVLRADLPLDGTLTVNGNIHGTGEIDPVRRFEANGGIDAGVSIQFSPPPVGTGDGVLQLDVPRADLATIRGFTEGNTIDVEGLVYNTAVFTPGTAGDPGVLALSGGADAPLELEVDGNYAPDAFVATPSATDTLVTLASCFCRGTRILTERGEVRVEELSIGDRIVTLSGATKPILWIGCGRDLVTRANKLARPVIVRAGALAEGVPHRDLYLTHGHALYLDGILIPVENLINHRSILWDESAQVVEYYHIELEDHDVVLAEGGPAESYYDAGNRAWFHNTRPGSTAGAAKPTFAPVLTGGTLVEQVWTKLFERAGGRMATDTTDNPDLHLVVDGRRLDPVAIEDCIYFFALPQLPAMGLHLRSRSGVPSLLGITAHDHRRLGVAIRRISVSQPGIETAIEPNAPLLLGGGCHPAESGYAWTDGELELPARLFAHLEGAFTLTVHIERPGMRYPVEHAMAMAA